MMKVLRNLPGVVALLAMIRFIAAVADRFLSRMVEMPHMLLAKVATVVVWASVLTAVCYSLREGSPQLKKWNLLVIWLMSGLTLYLQLSGYISIPAI